jgi:2-polyprenyl-3-methyl-5-hydroxy-6-metoxy-1,4-benzoquinol methylase
MYERILEFLKEKPLPYMQSTAPFWDDEHISKGMLAAHLNPDFEGASRKLVFIKKSVDWISGISDIRKGNKLLDLGCGPGIYAEMFYDAGFAVTGIDYSRRSIKYATEQAKIKHKDIQYIYMNYLDIAYENAFDFVTLIYCDFGVLPHADRAKLLIKIRKALKKGGILILDGFTEKEIRNFSETRTIRYETHGFWSSVPYMLIQSNYVYPETKNYLEQYIVVTENTCQCYNNWNQIYSIQSFGDELRSAGFDNIQFFDDVSGQPLTGTQNTLCAVAQSNNYFKG